MKHVAASLFLLLAACAGAPAIPTAQIDAELHALVDGFDGDVGIYVRHLERPYEYAHRADELFPTASMIKAPILGALLQRVEDGELEYHQKLTYTKDRLYAGEEIGRAHV